jgi:hypothetical protein
MSAFFSARRKSLGRGELDLVRFCFRQAGRRRVRSVIDLPTIAAPVDRNYGIKENELLSGSIDKGPWQPAVTFSRQGGNEEMKIALAGEKALTAALVMLMFRDTSGRASRWRLPHGKTGWRIFLSERVGSPSPWGSRSRSLVVSD